MVRVVYFKTASLTMLKQQQKDWATKAQTSVQNKQKCHGQDL